MWMSHRSRLRAPQVCGRATDGYVPPSLAIQSVATRTGVASLGVSSPGCWMHKGQIRYTVDGIRVTPSRATVA